MKAVSPEPQYVEAKLSCTEFQEAKKLLFQVKIFVASFGWKKSRCTHNQEGIGIYQSYYFQAFKKAELGAWVEKPMEQDEFETKTA